MCIYIYIYLYTVRYICFAIFTTYKYLADPFCGLCKLWRWHGQYWAEQLNSFPRAGGKTPEPLMFWGLNLFLCNDFPKQELISIICILHVIQPIKPVLCQFQWLPKCETYAYRPGLSHQHIWSSGMNIHHSHRKNTHLILITDHITLIHSITELIYQSLSSLHMDP